MKPDIWSQCTELSNVAKEKGKEFRINNQSKYKIEKIEVDGCLITDETMLKCDYMFVIQANESVYYVELKGTDIEHGCKQLLATYAFCKKRFEPYKSYFYIVARRIPKETPKTQNLKRKMRKMGIELHLKSQKMVLNL